MNIGNVIVIVAFVIAAVVAAVLGDHALGASLAAAAAALAFPQAPRPPGDVTSSKASELAATAQRAAPSIVAMLAYGAVHLVNDHGPELAQLLRTR